MAGQGYRVGSRASHASEARHTLRARVARRARAQAGPRVARRQAGAARSGRPFERFELDVDGVRLGGTELAHLHYVRELRSTDVSRRSSACSRRPSRPAASCVEGGAHLGFVTVHAARAAGPRRPRGRRSSRTATVLDVLRANLVANGVDGPGRGRAEGARRRAGNARFFVSGGGEMSSLYEPTGASDPIEVEVVRADDVVSTGRSMSSSSTSREPSWPRCAGWSAS